MTDYTGNKYNKLTALEFSHRGGKRSYWKFRCECGNEKVIAVDNVVRAKAPTKSCGCLTAHHKQGVMAIANDVFQGYTDGDLTFDEFYELSQMACTWCGICQFSHRYNKKRDLVFDYNGLDRIDNDLPHNRNNVIPACWTCNEMRGRMTVKQFLDWHNRVHRNVYMPKPATDEEISYFDRGVR